MIAKLVSCLLFPFALYCLEVQPWFGDVYQLHSLGSYSYSRFHSIQNGEPQLKEAINSHVFYGGLGVALSPYWNFDSDFQVSHTTDQSFHFRSLALQARYSWSDDITGDPVTFVTGGSCRFTNSPALKDFSCPSHGNIDLEANFSIGKEMEASDTWLCRGWFFGAVGQANRGSPWVRGIAAFESKFFEIHKLACFLMGINGYGRHIRVHTDRFYGYGKIREKAIDIGLRYGYQIDVRGTARIEYIRRVYAKSAPERVNTLVLSYFFPFSI